MSAANLSMLEYGADALAAICTDHAEAVTAATCAIRHAKSIPDALALLEILGLDAPPALLRHAGCGYLVTAAGRQVTCGAS